MDESLIKSFAQAGKPLQEIRLPDGTGILLSPYGGRALGLFAKGGAENFYWVNPVLREAGAMPAFFANPAWHNLGGDRTWVAPEIDFFFPNFPALTDYAPPKALDPGAFKAETYRGADGLASTFRVKSSRSQSLVELKITKSFSPAPNPLRAWAIFDPANARVQFAGYTQRTTLEFPSQPKESQAVGLWNLIQLPQGGEMLIPVLGRAKVTEFFGQAPASDLANEPSLVRCRMKDGPSFKFGLPAVSVVGRVGYFYSSSAGDQLVIRNFGVDPSGEYVDARWTHPDERGYAVQICNINEEQLGRFSELEYHAPAIGGTTGKNLVEDDSQVWAYRGDRAQLAKIAEALLGVPSLDR